jgi:pyridoxal phosphate enzyme (YggS family)
MVGSIADNLQRIRDTIDSTLAKTGRTDHVTLVAVTKTVEPERINEAVRAGVDIIGENRVQEAVSKQAAVDRSVRWHMVGHLQRNKVKLALPLFEMIQSLDKVETALEIEKRARKPVDVLVELNSTGEDTKSGVHPDGLFGLIDGLLGFDKLRIRGLMTIGPFTDDERAIRGAFSLTYRRFRELSERYGELPIDTLSMGMSGDYPAAIEEGANMVRLGTALFGARRS